MHFRFEKKKTVWYLKRYHPKFYSTRKTHGLYTLKKNIKRYHLLVKRLLFQWNSIFCITQQEKNMKPKYHNHNILIHPNRPSQTYRIRYPVRSIKLHYHPSQIINLSFILFDPYTSLSLIDSDGRESERKNKPHRLDCINLKT